MQMVQEGYQMTLDDLGIWSGKMCGSIQQCGGGRISGRSCRKSSGSQTVPVMCLDLTPGAGNLLGLPFWENDAAVALASAGRSILGESPSVAVESFLWQILEDSTAPKILFEPESVPGDTGKGKSKGEEAPEQLLWALKKQAGIEG